MFVPLVFIAYPVCESIRSFAKWTANLTSCLNSCLEYSGVEKAERMSRVVIGLVSVLLAAALHIPTGHGALGTGQTWAEWSLSGNGCPHRTEGNAPQPTSLQDPKRPRFAQWCSTLRIDFRGCFPEVVWLLWCYSFIRPGLWPPAGQTLFTLTASCSGGPHHYQDEGQLGQEAGSHKSPHPSVSLDVSIPPPHPPHISAFTSLGPWQGWARNATLRPREAFPGWGLEERGPGQVARADGRLPVPRGRRDCCQLPMPIPASRCSRECQGSARIKAGRREGCPGKMGEEPWGGRREQ